jgi:hypothetical protein
MNRMKRTSLGIVGLLAGALLAVNAVAAQTAAAPAGAAPAAGSDADAAPQKPKPKPRRAGPARVGVVVTDNRAVALTALFASPSGTTDAKKIAGPLDPGKNILVHLTHDKACLFDLHGDYADGTTTEAQGVELCKDKKINLIE